MDKISVLMSIYKNDKPEWFKVSINSIINQTMKPEEIVLIIDGEIPNELNNTIEELVSINPIIKLFRNEKNIGLGLTMQKGILLCSNELIARMDSDDYSCPDRLEKEYKFLVNNNLDLLGCHVKEFIDNTSNVVSEKKVPLTQHEIINYAKERNPLCHPTVLFKKSKVIEAGNYQDMKLCEDYYLWVRMIQKNCKVQNLDDYLVYMRVSEDLYARRGGYKYFQSQKKLFKYMKKTKFIGIFRYIKNILARFVVQVIMPNKLRQKFYIKKLRQK